MAKILATINLAYYHKWPKPIYSRKLWHQHTKVTSTQARCSSSGRLLIYNLQWQGTSVWSMCCILKYESMSINYGDIIIINIFSQQRNAMECNVIYSVSGLSCPEEEAYLTVIFHSFLHNNNINSDYILGANIIFTPHSNFSWRMTPHNQKSFKARSGDDAGHSVSQSREICQ